MEKGEHFQENEIVPSSFEGGIGGSAFEAVFKEKEKEPWYPKLKETLQNLYPSVMRDASYFLPVTEVVIQDGTKDDRADLATNMKKGIPIVFQKIYDYFFPIKENLDEQKPLLMTEDDKKMIEFILRKYLPMALIDSFPPNATELTQKGIEEDGKNTEKYPKYSAAELQPLVQQVREMLKGT